MRAAPVSVLAASLALAPACGGGGQAGTGAAFAFEQNCAACHSITAGKPSPNTERCQPGRRPPDARGGAPGDHRRTARDAEGARRRRRRRRRGGLRRPEDVAVSALPPDLDPAAVRAVAMDLDRTILADNLEFSPAVVRAVGRLGEAGIAAIVATGRMFASARPYALQLGVTAPVICYQGALVADPRTGEWLLHRPMGVALAHEVIEAVDAAGFHMNVYVDDELYVEELNEEAVTYATPRPARGARRRRPARVARQADDQDRRRRRSGGARPAPGRAAGPLRRPGVHRQVAADLPRACASRREQGLCARVRVRAARHRPRRTVVAFGDGANDVELLETAGPGRGGRRRRRRPPPDRGLDRAERRR